MEQQRSFFVRACWDADAEVFYAESDISGLHIEAKSIEEFEAVMLDVAVELALSNHIGAPRLATMSLKDMVPAILWQRPEAKLACA